MNKCGGTEEEEEDDAGEDGETQVHEEEIKRTKSVRIVSEKDDASPDDMKLKNCPSFSASYVSGMHPLPSEVAAGLKKGLYYFSGDEEEYGSSIFENWSIPGETNNNPEETKSKASKSVSWQTEDKVIPVVGRGHGSSIGGSSNTKKTRLSKHHRRSRSDGGLMSCFGNAYGFKFRLICGSNSMEEKKKKKEAGRHC